MAQNIKNLVWIDLEMTGLDPVDNTVLEIACIVTSEDLDVVAEHPALAINHSPDVLKTMDAWCTGMHTKSGLVKQVCESPLSLAQAESVILDFLKQYCYEKKSPLCGNSVWLDRFFMKFHMPRLYDFLHYRTIDVSTIKELIKRWYPDDPQTQFKKENTHRALADIHESINELRHYRRHFFKASSLL